MVGIRQFDPKFVPPRRKALKNYRIPACVCPMPQCVIDRHVNVSNPRRYGERGRPKYRHDVQILRAIPNEDNAT
jgi:hypothetical protein